MGGSFVLLFFNGGGDGTVVESPLQRFDLHGPDTERQDLFGPDTGRFDINGPDTDRKDIYG